MPVDYDLVIVGYTEAGIYAAKQAATQKARVALVEQNCQPHFVRHRAVANLVRSRDQFQHQSFLLEKLIEPSPINWERVNLWVEVIAQDQRELNSPAILAAAGVEFIPGSGEFCSKPQTGFVVNGRVLRSRNYLLALGHRPYIPEIDGLQSVGYRMPEDIFQPPSSLIVISSSATGTELAQLYARLGSQVTLISNQSEIIPHVDPEISSLLQAQLEVEGVRVLTGKVMQVRQIQSKKWVQVGNQGIEADEIVLATGWQSNLETLNLEPVGVAPLRINSKLQTKNHRVYWCGSFDPAIAKHEAAIAIKNALYVPQFKANYHHVPQTVFTDPEIAWIGLTERQAIQKFGKDVVTLRQSLKTLDKAKISGESVGLCKVIVRRNGEILGAHLVGQQASEVISAIALALQQKIKLSKLTQFATFSASEVLQNAALDWNAYKLRSRTQFQDALESFFAWRRSMNL